MFLEGFLSFKDFQELFCLYFNVIMGNPFHLLPFTLDTESYHNCIISTIKEKRPFSSDVTQISKYLLLFSVLTFHGHINPSHSENSSEDESDSPMCPALEDESDSAMCPALDLYQP